MMTAASVPIRPSTSSLTARPFLKWAGGKGRLLEQYQTYFPQRFRQYYEPFLGGGAVFFHLFGGARSAVLADLNPELVNVYRCVQHDVERVIDRLQIHQERHCAEHYYAVRAQTQLTCPWQRAARLIYLNKTCFNGLYRENSKGNFNVPLGQYKRPKICDRETLRNAAAALQVAHIVEEPFTAVGDRAQGSTDFVYFDPPYHPISATSNFTGYSRYGFRAADQVRLRDVFSELADRGVQVMLSNSDCELIRDLYAEFHIHEIWAARAINSNARRRGKITELLITSYPVP
ncbi:MAG: DNA adenine methylase [Leptolyngbyaceae cyanobacterium T60_A2020_046]|nr:DNA adenine methylase [Leptolyngbyaceae cyanobacterium T60_A2020_046]